MYVKACLPLRFEAFLVIRIQGYKEKGSLRARAHGAHGALTFTFSLRPAIRELFFSESLPVNLYWC